MVNFLRYCCLNCSVICCIFWTFWQAEAKSTKQVVGSTVVLDCNNTLIHNSNMIIWKKDGRPLFSLTNEGQKRAFNESVDLNLKMSDSKSQLKALIIEDAKKLHEGNYTCELTGTFGFWEEQWELIITGGNNSSGKLGTLRIAVIAGVPSACFIILLSVLIILTVRKRRAKNSSPTEIRQQKQVEDIYENHLEIQRRQAYLH